MVGKQYASEKARQVLLFKVQQFSFLIFLYVVIRVGCRCVTASFFLVLLQKNP
jgi:hypothetical protein